MSATSTDRNTKKYPDGEEFSYPVKTLVSIPLGTFVVTDSTGYLTKATDSATVKFQGVSEEAADNSLGDDGAINCKVRRKGCFDFASSGLAITDVGCDLYLSDNQTVTKTATNVYVGKMVKYISATLVTVDIEPGLRIAPTEDDVAEQVDLPVAATTAITANRLCCIDGSGNLVHAANTAGYQLAGESIEAADNSAGEAGDIDCGVQRNKCFTAAATGLTDADVGKPCWISNSTTITLTPGHVFAGFIASVASATACEVDLSAACNALKFEAMCLVLLPVAASANIGANDFICSKAADGYATNVGLTTSGYKLEGIAICACDNSSGADGALSVLVRRDGVIPKAATGLTLLDIGKPCWISDKDTITLTPGNVFAGFLAQYISATACQIDISAGCNASRLDNTGYALLPVAGNANISTNDFVVSKTDGYSTNASPSTAGYKLEGIALAPADNSLGADGAISVLVRRNIVVPKTLASVAITDIGKPCWISDADTVTLTPGNVFAGIVTKYHTTNSCSIDISSGCNHGRSPGNIFFMTFASADLPNSIPYTTFEFPCVVRLLRGYFQLGTAPGGSDDAVATITDGSNAVALTCSAAAVAAENEAINQVYPANTNMSVAFTDTGSTAANAQVTYVFEQL